MATRGETKMAIPSSDHYRVRRNPHGVWHVSCGGTIMPGITEVSFGRDTREVIKDGWVHHEPDGNAYVTIKIPARFVNIDTEPADADEQ